MTTITTTMSRLYNLLVGYSQESLDIPIPIVERVKGIVYVKHLYPGQMKEATHPGVFLKKNEEDGTWSNPVAIHFLDGTVSSSYCYDTIDLLVLICDSNAVKVMETMGQVGFDAQGYNVHDGVVTTSDRYTPELFDKKCEADPTFLYSTFAYHLTARQMHPAILRNVHFQYRQSSNEKYYNSRNANYRNILRNENLHTSVDHLHQIEQVGQLLAVLFKRGENKERIDPNGMDEDNQQQQHTLQHAATSPSFHNHAPPPPLPHAASAKGWGGSWAQQEQEHHHQQQPFYPPAAAAPAPAPNALNIQAKTVETVEDPAAKKDAADEIQPVSSFSFS